MARAVSAGYGEWGTASIEGRRRVEGETNQEALTEGWGFLVMGNDVLREALKLYPLGREMSDA